jgi:hypothetical protein
MTALEQLVGTWRTLDVEQAPFVLPGDEDLLTWSNSHSTPRHVLHRTYLEYAHGWSLKGSSDFHLGLLPQPYFGDLAAAKVFLLMLNPGFHPGDYVVEQEGEDSLRPRLIASLQQQPTNKAFLWLSPELAWCPGADYWLRRFRNLVLELEEDCGSERDALAFVSKTTAVLELVPYHSESFPLPDRVVRKLDSVRLMKNFVSDDLVPRARNGNVLIVATRRIRDWFPQIDAPMPGVLLYDQPGEARGASLSPWTRNGQELVAFLRGLLR